MGIPIDWQFSWVTEGSEAKKIYLSRHTRERYWQRAADTEIGNRQEKPAALQIAFPGVSSFWNQYYRASASRNKKMPQLFLAPPLKKKIKSNKSEGTPNEVCRCLFVKYKGRGRVRNRTANTH